MTAFSVFFCDAERCSIQPVRAMDPDHAIAQVRSRIPQLRRVAVVPDACSRAWIRSSCCRSGSGHGHKKLRGEAL